MKKQTGFTLKELITVMIMIAVLGVVLFGGRAEAHHAPGHAEEDLYVVGMNYLCCSKHHAGSDATNETHHGLGVTLTLPRSGESMFRGSTLGIMEYNNSYGDSTWLLSISKEFWHPSENLHIGLGAGYVNGYGDHLGVPFGAWISFRYKWIVITTVPTEVTAIGLHIPIAAFK